MKASLAKTISYLKQLGLSTTKHKERDRLVYLVKKQPSIMGNNQGNEATQQFIVKVIEIKAKDNTK